MQDTTWVWSESVVGNRRQTRLLIMDAMLTILTEPEHNRIEEAIRSWRAAPCWNCGATAGKPDEYVIVSNILHHATASHQRRAVQKKLAPELRGVR